jgi:hypothetical protein
MKYRTAGGAILQLERIEDYSADGDAASWTCPCGERGFGSYGLESEAANAHAQTCRAVG